MAERSPSQSTSVTPMLSTLVLILQLLGFAGQFAILLQVPEIFWNGPNLRSDADRLAPVAVCPVISTCSIR